MSPAVVPFEVLPARSRHALTVAIALAHVALVALLLQVHPIREAVASVAPLMVQIVTPDMPSKPAAPSFSAPRPLPQPAPALSAPIPPIPAPTLVREPLPEAPQAAPPPTTAVPVAVAVAAPAPAAAVPPTPPAPRRVPSSALSYRVQPPIAVPHASRRLGEAGTVVLRVVVDVYGLPRHVALERSSGYARLDEQALAAMRQARFNPCTDRGEAVECESSAALIYELEN